MTSETLLEFLLSFFCAGEKDLNILYRLLLLVSRRGIKIEILFIRRQCDPLRSLSNHEQVKLRTFKTKLFLTLRRRKCEVVTFQKCFVLCPKTNSCRREKKKVVSRNVVRMSLFGNKGSRHSFYTSSPRRLETEPHFLEPRRPANYIKISTRGKMFLI